MSQCEAKSVDRKFTLGQRISVSIQSLIFSLFLIGFSRAGFAAPAGVEVVPSLNFSSCFTNDEKFGRVPIPDCSATVKASWGDGPQIYKFNKMGLLDHDYSPKPDAKTIRVLLLGPLFDGFNLSPEESTPRRLEERLRAAGVKNIEVINGQISGFFAPRMAEYAVRLIKEYSPDVVVYFQPATAINRDMLEHRAVEFQGEAIKSFAPMPQPIEVPAFLGWLFPSSETQRMISGSYRQMTALWSLRRKSTTADEEARALVQPTISALDKIRKQLGPEQRLLVFYTAEFIKNGYSLGPDARPVTSFFNRLSPRLFIPPDLATLYMKSAGMHVYSLARGFRSPVQNELVYASHQTSITPQGAHAFAWSATYWMLPELASLKKGKELKSLKAEAAPRQKRHRQGTK